MRVIPEGLSNEAVVFAEQLAAALEARLKQRIDAPYSQYPFFVSRQITAVLRQELPNNRKLVLRCIWKMGQAGI